MILSKVLVDRIFHFDIVDKTPEDTARIMNRPDVEEMANIQHCFFFSAVHYYGNYNSSWNIKVCKYHGWSWREFLKEARAGNFYPL